MFLIITMVLLLLLIWVLLPPPLKLAAKIILDTGFVLLVIFGVVKAIKTFGVWKSVKGCMVILGGAFVIWFLLMGPAELVFYLAFKN